MKRSLSSSQKKKQNIFLVPAFDCRQRPKQGNLPEQRADFCEAAQGRSTKPACAAPGRAPCSFFKKGRKDESLLFLKNRKMDFRESTAQPAYECDLHTKHGTGQRQSPPMPDSITHKFFCTGPFSSMQADSLFVPVVRSCVSREIAGRNS